MDMRKGDGSVVSGVPAWLAWPVGLVALFACIFLALAAIISTAAGAYAQAVGVGAVAAAAFALGWACDRHIRRLRQSRYSAAADAASSDEALAATVRRMEQMQAETASILAGLRQRDAAGPVSAEELAALEAEAERKMKAVEDAMQTPGKALGSRA